MDAARFDALARALSSSSAGTRRRVVRLVAALPLAAGLAALLGEAAGAGRHRRRARHRSGNGQERVKNQRKRKRKGNKSKGKGKGKDKDKAKGKCVNAGQTPRNGKRCCSGLVEDGGGRCARPPSPPPLPGPSPRSCAETCPRCCLGETCVAATSTLQCGSGGAPCAPCAVCRRCNGAGQCVADANQNGACCPTGVCQNGSCVSGPCEPCGPATCANGCCAGDVCRIGVDSACGTGGGSCLDCTLTGRQCQNGQCVCVPITCPNNTCGSIDDGCGGTIACGPCQNPRPICTASNTCAKCQSAEACDPHHLCRDGSCFACDVVCDTPGGCDDLLQDAIDAADDGDTIYMCPGIYTGTITITKHLTLIGAGDGDGAGDTILDADLEPNPIPELDERGRTLTIGEGFNVTLRAMRITGGRGTEFGGGIYNNMGILTLTDCTVINNNASRGGGIFSTNDGAVSMTDCELVRNTATADGGGIYADVGRVTLTNTGFTDNTAGFRGGGVYSDAGSVTLTNGNVQGNTAMGNFETPGEGGGIYNVGGSVTLTDSSVMVNRATGRAPSGGGIFNAGTVTITRSTITDNVPDQCINFGDGADGCPEPAAP